MGKIYGYARVSTRSQIDGNSLEQQENQLKDNGAIEVIKEQFTGTKIDRPLFQELLKKLEKGDTLMVCKLDRFARSTVEGITTVRSLIEKGIKVHILNMGLIEDTPTGRLIFSVMSAFAEFERDMIVQRTQEGKAIAKQKEGFKEGRPKKYTKKQLDYAVELLKTHSYSEVVEITDISKSTLIREVRKRKANA
ncbi:recombinase family protein [Clostridium chauvoei]|uniref:Recombinase family protein n=2 Tax=Clostridium chauvoei TaxID=46867 RepID=A0ABD4RI01_9CLOT|nr:recombinase family protein [Clostridium chauvoei]ATD55419.1 resolvase [Clostridium chauvoei]ATD56909.1 resolvase [Clostridium chauvoei]MBX7280750.1 recombinase family protein [Clostridium chauvoei]MBX7283233.1 recombinase family protein [Clostridium chauvoei]MBX7285882.1 recombinase family protein [Clostridium chauvoei]